MIRSAAIRSGAEARVMIALRSSQLPEILRRVDVDAAEVAGVVRLVFADPVPGVADLDEAAAVRLDALARRVVPEPAVVERGHQIGGRRAARAAQSGGTRRTCRACRTTTARSATASTDCPRRPSYHQRCFRLRPRSPTAPHRRRRHHPRHRRRPRRRCRPRLPRHRPRRRYRSRCCPRRQRCWGARCSPRIPRRGRRPERTARPAQAKPSTRRP